MNSKKLGEKIRRIRAMKGYSQANIAEDLGITAGAYAKIERGEIDPNTARLYEIAKSLDVPVTEFFEESKANLKEAKGEYGYITKHEFDTKLSDLTHSILKLTKAVEKIQEQLPQKAAKKATAKKDYMKVKK